MTDYLPLLLLISLLIIVALALKAAHDTPSEQHRGDVGGSGQDRGWDGH